MPVQDSEQGMLAPYRALDLTDDKGLMCGRILGDLGADVIKIEKPGGDPARNIGPFYHDEPHPEKSLYWFALSANRRGITLDITTADGQAIFQRMVKSADFVLESFDPGYLDKLGLGYATLSQINPRVVMTSITPFGQTGPFRDYQGPDIVAMAMSGLMNLCGDPDRPPVRISVPQSYIHGGVQGAMGTLIAHYHREITGQGQQVDVSIQESVAPTIYNARLFWEFHKVNLKRTGPYRGGQGSLTVQRLHYPCKDGYVAFVLFGGAAGATTNKKLVEWMADEGMAPDFMKNKDWSNWDFAKINQPELDLFEKPIMEFFKRRTKQEIFEAARKRRIMLYPMQTAQDVFEDPQLKARNFWTTVEHPELAQSIVYPGCFARFSEAPCRIRRRAPLIGEHNEEIYHGELGMPQEELVRLKEAGII
jgi:crotonobetainyl-CoA:carnitine CoA-transferase CaiB-like acyl-CoA transferase